MSVPSSPSTLAGLQALARFPAEVQASHDRYLKTGDASAADSVLLAVLRDFMPKARGAGPDVVLPDESRLMEDLGFDSLAVAEVVFFLEDLYQVRIPQEQLLQLRRVGDLRSYLKNRLQSPLAASTTPRQVQPGPR